jgi:cell division protein FtsZ
LITIHGFINVDFADVRTVMSNMGRALMGTGYAMGDRKALEAAQQAISSPLLEDNSIEGATGILINITGGPDLTLTEINEAATLIQEASHEDANIIFGSVVDANMEDQVRITVIATGFDPHFRHESLGAAKGAPLKRDNTQQQRAAKLMTGPAPMVQVPTQEINQPVAEEPIYASISVHPANMAAMHSHSSNMPQGAFVPASPLSNPSFMPPPQVIAPDVAQQHHQRLGQLPTSAPQSMPQSMSQAISQSMPLAQQPPTAFAYKDHSEGGESIPAPTRRPRRGFGSQSIPRIHPGLVPDEHEMDVPAFIRRQQPPANSD